ncbi:MAG: hypothetical protein WC917_03945 [Bacilli bacterium]|jgi:hypothetical protein
MKHNKKWFYNRIGKRVYCNDHGIRTDGDQSHCGGIDIESEVVAENLFKAQEEREVLFSE